MEKDKNTMRPFHGILGLNSNPPMYKACASTLSYLPRVLGLFQLVTRRQGLNLPAGSKILFSTTTLCGTPFLSLQKQINTQINNLKRNNISFILLFLFSYIFSCLNLPIFHMNYKLKFLFERFRKVTVKGPGKILLTLFFCSFCHHKH